MALGIWGSLGSFNEESPSGGLGVWGPLGVWGSEVVLPIEPIGNVTVTFGSCTITTTYAFTDVVVTYS